MLQGIVNICRENPHIIVFLVLAIGYFIGGIKIRSFSLGSTTGVLIIALIFGHMDIEISSLTKMVAFALFMFCMGYQIGPQFFDAIRKEGVRYILLAFVVALTGLVVAILLGRLLHFDPGTTAGVFSGAMTQSSAIGTAEDVLQRLSISVTQKSILNNNITVAFTLTSVFGTIGLIIFYKIVLRLMKVDLKQEAEKLGEEGLSDSSANKRNLELFSWYKRLNMRAYCVENLHIVGKTVGELEAMFPGRIAVNKMRRGNQLIDPDMNTVIESDDVLALVGKRDQFLDAVGLIGSEVDDKSVMDLTGEILNVCVLNPGVIGKTLAEISREHGHGCFLRKITRHGHELPLANNVIVKKCDILQIVGPQKDVEHFVKYLGHPERSTEATDLVVVGLGCALGFLLGLIHFSIAGIPITLGVGGGVLISGLLFGWLRSLHPTFGQIPSGAQWIFTDFGLNLFVACIGLSVGSGIIHDLQAMGMSVFFAGVFVTLLPMVVGLMFGKFILKLNPILLFGALAGAETMVPVLYILKEESESSTPALGYTIPFAFGNIFLTIWGAVIMKFMFNFHF